MERINFKKKISRFGTLFIRIISRLIFYILLLIVSLNIGLFCYLQTDFGSNKLKQIIITQLQNEFDVEVKIKRLAGGIFYDCTLEKVLIRRKTKEIMSIERVSFDYVSYMLLGKVVYFKAIQIDNPVLKLKREIDGKWNVSNIFRSDNIEKDEPGTKDKFRIIAKRILIRNGSLQVENTTTDRHLNWNFRNIQSVMRLSIKEKTILDVKHFSFRSATETKIACVGNISYDPAQGELTLDRASLDFDDSNLALHGNVITRNRSPYLKLMGKINSLSLESISEFARFEHAPEGEIRGDFNLTGSPDDLTLDVDVWLNELEIRAQTHVYGFATNNGELTMSGEMKHFDPTSFLQENDQNVTYDINTDFRLTGKNLLDNDWALLGTFDFEPSEIFDVDINEGSMTFEVSRNRLTIGKSYLQTPNGLLKWNGSIAGLTSNKTMKFILETEIQDLNTLLISKTKRIPGTLNIEANITGHMSSPFDLRNFEMETRARIKPSTLHNIEISDGEFSAAWQDNSFIVNSLKLNTIGSVLSVNGSIQTDNKWADLSYVINLSDLSQATQSVRKLDFGIFSSIPNFEKIGGSLTLRGSIIGPWLSPTQSFMALGKSIQIGETFIDSIKLNGEWEGSPDFFASSLNLRFNSIEYKTLKFSQLEIDAELSKDIAGVNIFIQQDGLSKTSLSGDIKNWLHPNKSIIINCFNSTANNLTLSNNHPIHVSLYPERIKLEAFSLLSEHDNLEIILDGELTKRGDQSLEFAIEQFPLDLLSYWLPQQPKIQGRFSGNGRFGGTWPKPEMTLFGFGNEITGNHFNIGTIEVEGNLKHQTETASGELIVNLTNSTIAKSKFSQIRLESVWNSDKIDMQLNLSRISGTKLYVDGTMESVMKSDKTLRINTLEISSNHFQTKNSEPIEIQISGQTVSLSPFSLKSNEMEISGSGTLTESGSQSVYLNFKNLEAADLSRLLWDDERVIGTLNGDLELHGSPAKPEINLKLNIIRGKGYSNDFSEMNLAINYLDSKSEINGTVSRDNRTVFTAAGHTNVSISLIPFEFSTKGKEIDLTLKSENLRLSDLPIIKDPGMEYDGTVMANLHVTGDLLQPDLQGSLSLQDGFLTVKKKGLTYESLSGELSFQPGKIHIPSIDLKGNKEGHFHGEGDLDIVDGKISEMNLRVSGTDVYIPFKKIASARINPDLTITGTVNAPMVTGTISITEGRLNVDRIANSVPPEIHIIASESDNENRIQEFQNGSQEESSILNTLSSDINVNIQKNSWLKGRDINIEMAGDINLRKTKNKPFILMGSLNTIRGTYDFRGRLFKVTKGNVTFLGTEELNPNLEIQAKSRIKNIDIIVDIGGTAGQMNLSFDSRPKMVKTDIMSYLIFGRPFESNSGDQAVKTHAAAYALTGYLAENELKKLMGDVILVDTFSLDFGGEDIRTGSVNLGKYISPKVFLSYRHGFSSEEPPEIKVNYEISPHFSIETQTGEEKSNGIDLILEVDY